MCPQETKVRAPEKISPVSSKIVERFDVFLAGDGIAILDELKRPVVEALHFGHSGSTKMPAENSIFRWSRMKEDIENKCSTCTAYMSSGGNIKYQLPSTEKNQTNGVDRNRTRNTN